MKTGLLKLRGIKWSELIRSPLQISTI